ncbi:NUDIX domain-containing protein [Streptomyces sp. NBC_01497]|uniref:NUDIX domain-containing protein n=1 Tax=Streptomyces sp. NBC_01497 TaxID=2903885 RepID=UPI002E2F52A7|nr:NUDIX domain-containing protein [Streptomyces sp. NBC_01497]
MTQVPDGPGAADSSGHGASSVPAAGRPDVLSVVAASVPHTSSVVAAASVAEESAAPGAETGAIAHTGTAALIVNDAGHYLLHLRDHIPGICDPGAWSLIGGGREGEETAKETVDREIHEEIGLVLPGLRPLGLIRLTDGGGAVAGRIQLFLGRWNGDAHALPLTEGVMCHWFPASLTGRLRLSPIAVEAFRLHRRGA